MKAKINGILAAIRSFEDTRREQATAQSDRDPWSPPKGEPWYGTTRTQETAVAPLQGAANTYLNEGCGCDTICPSCVDYQMTLNQAH